MNCWPMLSPRHLSIIAFSTFATVAHADLILTETLDASILANEVMDTSNGNLVIDSESVTGFAGQAATFTNGLSVPGFLDFENGLILSSGSVAAIVGPNGNDGTSTALANGIANDADFDALTDSANGTDDAVFIEIDFIPNGDTLTGTFVFASEEYNEYAPPDGANSANNQFYDVMAFFVNGINYSLTADGDDVSINSVNKTLNAADFIDNDYGDFLPGPTPFNIAPDGFTRRLSWTAPVNPGVINTLKFGVADGGDASFDSWLLMDRNSFRVLSSPVDVDLTMSFLGTGGEIAEGTPMVIATEVVNLGANDTGREMTVVHTLPAGVTINGGAAASVAESGVNGDEWVCISTAAVPQAIECRSITPIGTTAGNSASIFNFTTDPIDASLVGTSIVNSATISTTDTDTDTSNDVTSDSTLVVALDTTPPVVTINDAPPIAGSVTPYTVTLLFDEVVTGLDVADIVVGNGSASDLTILSPLEATVVITPDANGDISIDVPAGAVQDASSNDNAASATVTTVFDPTSPVLSIDNAPGVVANTDPFDVTFAFNVPVTGFALNDINVSNGVASNLIMLDSSTWTATVSPDTTNDIVISVPAAAAQGSSNGVNSSGAGVTVALNASAPTGVLSGAPLLTNSLASYPMTLTWSEDVTDMTASDISITNGTISSFAPETPLVPGSVYTFDVTPAGDGNVTISVPESSVVDVASNGNPPVSVTTVVDSTPPSLTIDVIAGDDFINASEDDAPLTISGTSAGIVDGEDVSVGVNGTIYTGTVSGDSWSITVPAASVQGFDATELITADAVDAAGNVAPQATRTINYDVVAPAQPGVNAALVNSALPTLTGNATTSPGDILTVTVGGNVYIAGNGFLVDDLVGGWTLTIPPGDELLDGSYSVVVTVTDPAGNASSDISNNELTVDTTPPATPSIALDLVTADDSGVADNDNITNVAGASFSLPAGTATSGDLVTLYSEGTPKGTATVQIDGSFIVIAGTLDEVAANMTWTSTDAAGNESAVSPALPVTLDITSPAPIVVSPHTADNIINAAEADPFSVSGTSEPGSAVTVSISDGSNPVITASVTADGSGDWTINGFDVTSLNDGALTIVADAVDIAGNTGSSAVSNTTLNASVPVLVLNTIAGDDALNISEAAADLVIDGSSTNLVNGETVSVDIAGNLFAASVTSGLWQITVPAAVVTTLVDGASVTASATDSAGNDAAPVSTTLTVDTTEPAVVIDPIPLATAATASSYAVSGSCSVGDGNVSITINGAAPVSQNANCDASGLWSASFDVTSIVDGLNVIVVDATQTDAVGNTGTAANQSANKDTGAPSISIAVVAGDDVINVTEAGGAVLVTGSTADIEDGQNVTVTIDGVSYNATVTANTWSVSIPVADITQFESVETITADVSTVAGLAATQATRDINYDVMPPSAPTIAPELLASDDSGSSNSDNISNVVDPSFSLPAGTVPGGTSITLYNGGAPVDSVTSAADGSVSFTFNGSSEGSHSITWTSADAAGNESAASPATLLVLDITAPTPSIDTPITADNIVNASEAVSLSIAGTSDADTTVSLTISDGSNPVIALSAPVDGLGVWSSVGIDVSSLDEGALTLSITGTDLAGNTGSGPDVGTQLQQTTPVLSFATLATDDALNAIETTQDLVVVGTSTGLADGESVTVSVGVDTYTAIVTGNQWQVTIPSADVGSFVDGEVITADATNAAGNSANTINVALAVDTVMPVVAINAAELATSSNETIYQVSGSCTAGDGLVSVSIGGATPATQDVSCAAGGSWTATFDIAAITDGLDVVVIDAAQSDAVGNTANAAPETANKDTGMPSISISVVAIDDVINIDEAAADVVVDGITVDIEDGQLVTLSVDGADYTTTVISNTWSIVVPVSAVSAFEIDEDLTANVTTLAGLAAPEALRAIDVDVIAPAMPTVATLVTNDTTPTITGTAVVQAGDILIVTVNGTDYVEGTGALSVTGTDWTLDVPPGSPLSDAVYDVVVSLTDAADNETIAPGIAALTVDTTAPAAPPVAVDLITADDSGISDTDDITNVVTPTFVVADGTLTPGESVTVYADAVEIGTTVVSPAGGFSLLSASFIDGSYSISYTLADALDNVSGSSPALPIVIDTLAEAPTINPDIMGDDIISASELSAVLVSGMTEADATVTIDFLDIASATESVIATAEASGIYTLNATPADLSALTAGGILVSVSMSDVAGNQSAVTSVSVQLDPDPPLQPTVNTLLSNSGTPTISGTVTLAAGDSLRVTLNSEEYLEGADLVVTGNAWTLTVPPVNALLENTFDVIAEAIDAAGNVASDASVDELTVDLTAPVDPVVSLDLVSSSDTGGSDSDDLTGLTTVDVLVPAGTANPDETATVYLNGVAVETLTVATDGSFGTTLSGLLVGPNNVSYTLSDAAGNTSSASPDLVVIVDNDIVTPTLNVPLAIDNLINGVEANMVDLDGTAEADSLVTVTITDGGSTPLILTVTANGSGGWTLSDVDVTSLSEGILSVSVSSEDEAGNVESAAPADVELDITAPSLTLAVIAGDDVINVIESLVDQTLSGTSVDLVDGSVVTVDINGQSYSGTVASNTWSVIVPTLDVQAFDSTEDVVINASDVAGNAAPTVTRNITTLFTAPTLSIAVIAVDDVINAAESLLDQTISGTSTGLADGETVTVNVNGVDYSASVVADTWSVLVPAADVQAFGPSETVTATASDAAGNSAVPATVDVVTDVTAPVLTLDAIAGDDRINAAESTADITVSGSSLGLLDGESVVVSVNALDYVAVVGSDVWSVVIPALDVAALTDGNQVTATATDAAGNDALPVTTTLIVDTVVPVASINAPALATAANSASYQVSGSCTVDEGSLDVSITGATPATQNVACAADGSWTASFDVTAVADGLDTLVINAAQTDAVGNIGVATSVTANKDTTAPSISIAAIASDDVINQSESGSLLLIGGTTSNIGDGQVVTVIVAGISFSNAVNSNQWLVLVPVSAVQTFGASETVTADVSTAAGVAADTATRDISVDVTPPPAPTVATIVTANDTPTITGTATLSASDTLTVLINTVPYVDGDGHLSTDGLGGWSLTIPAGDALSDDVYDVQVTATDSAGNASTIPGTAALTVDTTAPDAPVAPLDLAASSDSGVSDSDDITNDNVPLLELASSSAAPGTIVRIYEGAIEIAATTLDASGGFSVNSNVLVDGIYSISYQFEDALGNMSASSPALAVEIDTVATVPVISTPVMSDGFVSAVEEATVLVEGTTEADAEVTIEISDTSAALVSTSVTASSGGDWNNSGSLLDVSSLTEGDLQIVANVTDIAGNTASSTPEVVSYDAMAPAEPTVTALVTNTTTPTLGGTLTLAPGETFTVTVDGVEYSEGTNLTQDGTSWTLVIPAGTPLVDGTFDVAVEVMDAAGNTISDSGSNELTVDLNPPADPTTLLDLLAVSDTGSSDTDNLTNLETVDVALPVGSAEADATVEIYVDGVLSTSTTANTDGSVSATLSGLTDGVRSLTYVVIDEAGNASGESPALDVTVDTMIDVPVITTPIAADNTISAAEATAVTLNGTAEPNSEVTVTVEDALAGQQQFIVMANASGQWQIANINVSALLDGPLTVDATSLDDAGNSQLASTAVISKDTTGPTLALATVASDDAINATESLLDQTISGTSTGLADGETVTVNVNGVDYSASVVADTWSVLVPAADVQAFGPSETVTATASDAAGNSAVPATVDVVTDVTAPVLTLDAIAGDDRINAAESTADITVSGSSLGLLDGESVVVSVNALDYVAVVGSDVWSVVIPALDVAALTDGNQVTATATDAAGNDALPVTTTLIVDTVVPVASINAPALATAANSASYQVSGSCTVDEGSLDVSITGATPATQNVACAADGSWTASFDVTAVADGLDTLVINAAQTDAVGNIGVATSVTANKDTTAPSISIAAIASDDVINQSESGSLLLIGGTTSNIGDGQVVTVIVAGISFSNAVNSNQWLVLVPVSAVQTFGASETVTADVSTAAGVAADTATRDISVDVTPPPAPTVATIVTANDTPTITGTATLSASDTLTVLINTVPYVDGDGHLSTDGLGGWSLTIPAGDALSDDVYDVQVTATDSAGNASTIPGTAALTVDTTAPDAPVAPLDLAASSDSGVSDSDDITNDNVPLLELASSSAAPGTIVRIYEGAIEIAATTLDASGGFSVNSNVLVDGIYSISYQFEDALGNMSASSPALAVEIDTVATVPVISTPVMSDGFVSAVEEATVLVEGTTEADAEVTIEISDTSAALVSTSVTASSGGDWNNSGSLLDVSSLTEGDLQIVANVTDIAGNTASSTPEVVSYDAMAPAEPTVTALVTNTTTPTLGGTLTLAPGETFTVTVDGVEYSEGTNLTQDGTSWTLVIPAGTPLVDGTFDVAVEVMDAAGNTISDSGSNELTVDLNPPADPTTLLDLLAVSDTGSSDTDNLTNLETVDVALPVGSAEADATVEIYVDGVLSTSTTANTDGSVSATLSGLTDGVRSLTYVVIDEAGNASGESPALDVTVDRAIATPTINTPIAVNDIANTAEAGAVTLNGTAEPNSDVSVTISDTAAGVLNLFATSDASGDWEIPDVDLTGLLDGALSIVVDADDDAGNMAAAPTESLLLDTSGPTVALAAIAGDDVINAAESLLDQTVSGTSMGLADGESVTINVNGVDYSAFVTADSWSVLLSAAEVQAFDPLETVTVSATDSAGNPAIPATVDVVSNTTIPVVAFDVIAGDDRLNASEVLTDVTISGSSADLIDGAIVTVDVDGAPYDAVVSTNTWSITVPSLVAIALPPSNLITANANDDAGNSAIQAEVTLIVDVAPPVVTIATLPLATGANQISYQVSGDCDAGDGAVQVSIADATPALQSVACAVDGTWSATADVSAVAEGLDIIVVNASQIDAAGNAGSAGPATANKDTTAPSISIATVAGDDAINISESGGLLIVQGTTGEIEDGQFVTVTIAGINFSNGVSANQWLVLIPASAVQTFGSTELITANVATLAGIDAPTATRSISVDLTPPNAPAVVTLVTNVTTPTISGTADTSNGETLEVTVNGSLFTSGDGHLADHGDGTWTLTIPSNTPLSEGVFDVEVTLVDPAGNSVVEAGTGALTIDTTAPVAPLIAPDLLDADDSGDSNSDEITNVTTARFAVVAGEALPDMNIEVLADGIVVGAGSVDADGSFIVATAGLVDGSLEISYRYVDAAGNVGLPSPVLDIVVDTFTDVPVLAQPIMVDDVINATESVAIVVTGSSEADSTLSLTIEDTSGLNVVSAPFVADSSGDFTSAGLDASLLGDGSVQFHVVATDVAGNVATGAPVSIGLLTAAPAAPTIVTLATDNSAPTVMGTAPAGAGSALEISLNGSIYQFSDGSLVDTGAGGWSLTVDPGTPLNDGVYDLVASYTNAIGNSSADTTVDELLVDTIVPATPTVMPLLTNTVTPVLLGTAVVGANERLTVEVNGTIYGAVGSPAISVNDFGNWALAIGAAEPLPHGVYEVVARVQDAAGNGSVDASSFEVEIDLIAPAIDITAIDDDDVIGSTQTAAVLPIGGGTDVLDGTTVSVDVDGSAYSAVVASGSWSISLTPAELAVLDDSVVIMASVTDPAGNLSLPASRTLTIDRTAPALTIDNLPPVNAITASAVDITGSCESGFPVEVSVLSATPTTQSVDCVAETYTATFDTSAIADGVGAISVEASQDDAAGNAAAGSITIDKDAVAPSITVTSLGEGSDGVINNAESLSFGVGGESGETQSGDVVTLLVSDGVNSIDTTTAVDGSGAWQVSALDLSVLDDGPVSFTATVMDASGNQSAPDTIGSTLRAVLPSITIVQATPVWERMLILTGTSALPPNAPISISDGDGNTICNVGAELGSWTCAVSGELPDGSYAYVARVTDLYGNVGTANLLAVVDADIDTDADSIPDAIEGTADTDNDGVPDNLDLDSDGDGIPDSVEGSDDPDGDSVPSFRDTDSDGDTIDDSIEGVLDSDQDGVPDYLDTDSDGDGISDDVEVGDDPTTPLDTDADGQPDYIDLDSDNDGLLDVDESSDDADGDGIIDVLDNDSNNDGIPDNVAGTGDFDSDGTPDYLDEDIDNDGIPNSVEGLLDSDGDGEPDFRDLDSDGDSIPDAIEGDNDANGNGIPDFQEFENASDADGDGIADANEGTGDTDNDGISDFLDTDSDNDGLPDSLEGGLDTDNDGIPDFQDRDSDNDSIGDAIEGTEDSDGDSLPDYIDTDSDGDTIEDIVEANVDTDQDGIPNLLDLDSDNDRLPDSLEGSVDSDSDGLYDAIDLDSDNDGLPDSFESVRTGVTPRGLNIGLQSRFGFVFEDAANPAQNQRLFNDFIETAVDTDADLVPDYLDLDSDNDSIPDTIEADGPDVDQDGRIDNFIDLNQNGWDDAIEQSPLPADDTDGDGLRDFRDVDSDQDGLPDLVEVQGVDADGNGLIDAFTDVDADGLDDGVAIFTATLVDSDDDGIFNFREIDSDNDSLTDLLEAGGSDSDGDGIVDALRDRDGDGIPDSVDVDVTGGSDADNDGIDDSADTDFATGGDMDFDGIIDARDPDANGDGFADGAGPVLGAALPDTDGNQVPDYQEAEQAEQTKQVQTGVYGNGIGCSIGGGTGSPSGNSGLLLMILAALVGLYRSRRRTVGSRHVRISRLAILTVLVASVSACSTLSRVLPGDRGSDSRGVLTDQQQQKQLEQQRQRVEKARVKQEKKERNRSMRRFYAGLGFGKSILAPVTEDTGFTLENGSSTATHLHLGFDYSPRIALEFNAGSLGMATLEPTSTINYGVAAASGLFYFGEVNESLIRRVNMRGYGRVGLGALSTSGSGVEVEQVNGLQLLIGLGVEYGMSNGLAVRGEFISYDGDARAVQLGLIYRFKNSSNNEQAVPQSQNSAKREKSSSQLAREKREETRRQAAKRAEARKQAAKQAETKKQDLARRQELAKQREGAKQREEAQKQATERAAEQAKAQVRPLREKKSFADSDADGVVDGKDACVNTPRGVPVDSLGCALTRGTMKGLEFEANTEQFKPGATRVLDRLVAELKAFPRTRITISVHTDNSFPKRQANQITTKQVIKIVKYLAKRGVSTKRIVAKSYGSSKPLAENITNANRSLNRRVEITNLADM